MPIIKPDKLSEEILRDPFRKAEITVYEACKKLPDTWYVLYGVVWIDNDRRDRATEGEADFIIICPEVGLVVIEVKGGGGLVYPHFLYQLES